MVGDPCPMHKHFHTILGLPRTLFCPAYTMAGTNHHGCSTSSVVFMIFTIMIIQGVSCFRSIPGDGKLVEEVHNKQRRSAAKVHNGAGGVRDRYEQSWHNHIEQHRTLRDLIEYGYAEQHSCLQTPAPVVNQAHRVGNKCTYERQKHS